MPATALASIGATGGMTGRSIRAVLRSRRRARRRGDRRARAKRAGMVRTSKSSGAASVELLPRHGRRHGRGGHRPDRVRGRDEELAVVDVDPGAAVALEPLGRRLPGHPAHELAGQGLLRARHRLPAPARRDRRRHVHAPAARRLRAPRQAVALEQAAQLDGHADRVGEPGPGLRVEVDPQLVGMRRIIGADRRGMEAQGAEAGRPRDDGQLGRVDAVGLGAHPRRHSRGRRWKIARPAIPPGQRSSIVGRSRTAARIPSPTARK